MLIDKVSFYSSYLSLNGGGTFEWTNPKTGRDTCIAELICGDSPDKHSLQFRQAASKHTLCFAALFFITAKYNEVIEKSKETADASTAE
jgi:hypothetical protein